MNHNTSGSHHSSGSHHDVHNQPINIFSSVFTFLEEIFRDKASIKMYFSMKSATSSSGEKGENEKNETSNEESEESHHEKVILRRST
jgi:hypothetical protein